MENKDPNNLQEKLTEVSIRYEYEIKTNKSLTSENKELKAQIKRMWTHFLIVIAILGILFSLLAESALNKIEPRTPADGYQLAGSEADYVRAEGISVNDNGNLEDASGNQGARSKLDTGDAERQFEDGEIETMPNPISPDDFIGPMPSPTISEDFADPIPSPNFEKETKLNIPSTEKISEELNGLNDKLIEKTEDLKSKFGK